jgi:hypothetical protein
MPPLTNLEKQRRQIERERAAGLIRTTVTIPEKRKPELKEIVAKWMKADTKPADGSES